MTKVSVIIPCYNDGKYLKDAVSSVAGLIEKGVEIIIVNDGSTDADTIELLESYYNTGIKVLSHENRGLAYTRNRGISEAKGKYILPLDADNVIKHRYIEKGVEILDNGEFDIVYANPFFIGEMEQIRKFESHAFVGQDLFFGNYIDACAIFKKSVWESASGYDEKMPYQGFEDWDFWLSSYLAGFKFKHIDEELYGYRIRGDSMMAGLINEKKNLQCHDYIIQKHALGIVKSLRPVYDFYKKHHNKRKKRSLKKLVKPMSKLFAAKNHRRNG
jgi:glycosyltransferase involved in cell wall biosynthesis